MTDIVRWVNWYVRGNKRNLAIDFYIPRSLLHNEMQTGNSQGNLFVLFV